MAADAEKDLALLEQVELKFALASTEAQLQRLLNQFLAPIIRKAVTPNEAVRARVVAILAHIRKRLNASPSVFIPGLDLAALLQADSPIAQNLALTFLQGSAVKLPNQDQARLIPKLAAGLGSRLKPPIADLIFQGYLSGQMIPQAVQLATLKGPEEVNVYLGLSEADRGALFEKLYQFMLHGWAPFSDQPPHQSPSTKVLQCSVIKYVSQPIDNLPKWPFGAYRVVLAGSVAASRDNAELAAGLLKRVEQPDLESALVLNRLVGMYLEREAPMALKTKLMDWFSKSTLMPTTFPQVLQVAFDGLHGTSTCPKLRLRALTLLQWLIRKREDGFIAQIAPVLLSGILKLLDEGSVDDKVLSVIGAAYVTLGSLGSRAHPTFQKDILLLSRMFSDLDRYRQLVPQIKDGLSMALAAYQGIETWGEGSSAREQLHAILELAFRSTYAACRHQSVRYMLAVFPEWHLPSRFLLILGTGDQDGDVKEAAIAGLGNLAHTPGLTAALDLIEYCHNRMNCGQRQPYPLAPHHLPSRSSPEFLVAGYPSTAMLYLILYTWSLATHRPLEELLDSHELEREVEGRSRLGRLLLAEGLQGPSRLLALLKYLRDACSQSSDTRLRSVAASLMCQIVCCASPSLLAYLANDLAWFKAMALAGGSAAEMMARAYAIILVSSIPQGSTDPLPYVSAQLKEALACVIAGKVPEARLRAVLMPAGFLVGRFLYRFPRFAGDDAIGSMVDACLVRIEPKAPPSQLQAAILALQECGRYGQIPKALEAFERLGTVLRATSDTKVAEAVLLTLGHLAVGNPNLAEPTLQKLIDLPYPLNKNVEVYLRAGEAIACVASGHGCPLVALHLDVPPHTAPATQAGRPNLEAVVSQLAAVAKADSQLKRKGAAFCLLSVVKFCRRDTRLAPLYPSLHSVFLSLLANHDALVQEVAAAGLALIYDHAAPEDKGKLVASLMAIFAHGQPLSQTMAGAEADLYGGGQGLGRAPDGSPLNTYRSVLSLAADMNQPELIYPFLQLARSNAVWASRQGAAFGLARLLGSARDLIAPHLSTFLPRLFRFRYDPDAQVARVMAQIWDGLFQGDSARAQELLDQNFPTICQQLLDGMGDRSWRIRQSSSAALAHLLLGRRNVDFAPYRERVWGMSFRAMDDIKESVREAGLQVSRAASALTLQSVETHPPRQGAAVLVAVVPFLVGKGLGSDVEDVRRFSIDFILKLVQKAGPLLTPHLVVLIPNLLEAMTTLEPPEANYLTFHVDRYNLSQEQLDSYRLAALNKSPLALALTTCLRLLDADGLGNLVPELSAKIRSSVGFATKAGCARAVATLVSDRAELLYPHAGAILKAILVALWDPSAAIRNIWATTLGAISKLVEVSAYRKLLQDLCNQYLESEDPGRRLVSAIAVLEMSKQAAANFVATREGALPIAYFGSFDTDPEASRVWGEVWGDNTAGTTSALKTHQVALFHLAEARLSTTAWSTKQQAAKCIGEVAKQLGEDLDVARAEEALGVLLSQLPGRVWEGKECLWVALGHVACAGRRHFLGRGDLVETIFQAWLRDMGRKNLAFKTRAIQVASEVLPALEVDVRDRVFSALLPIIRDGSKGLAQDDDVIDAHVGPRLLVLKSHAIRCVLTTLPRDISDIPNGLLVELVATLSKLHAEAWNVRLAVLEGLRPLLAKFGALEVELLSELWPPLMAILADAFKDGKYLQLRLAAVAGVVEVAALPQVRSCPHLVGPLRAIIALGCQDASPQVSERLAPLAGL
ncbi:proteasome component M29 [Massospora cicadina]|nr:proteasome component M29 [Massospora cicadina]